MSCLRPLTFLVTTPLYTLPNGDKANVEQGRKECRLWIETAASTAIAAALTFPTILATRYLQVAIENIGPAIGIINTEALNIISMVGGSLLILVLMSQYKKIDTQAAQITNIFLAGYYSIKAALQQKWISMPANLTILFDTTYEKYPLETTAHKGCLRPYIERKSQAWAATMASLFGYYQ